MQRLVDDRINGHWSCFSTLDRGHVPEPVEDASEAAWREFDACWEALEMRLRGEGPLRSSRPVSPPGEARHAVRQQAAALQVDGVMRLARANDRVCPVAAAWRRLHLLLGVLVQPRRRDPAPPPIESAAWSQTTDLHKRLRLREQLDWAQQHGGLHVAHEFVLSLPEDDWHHHTPMAWPTL
jgi:hypothetical protein